MRRIPPLLVLLSLAVSVAAATAPVAQPPLAVLLDSVLANLPHSPIHWTAAPGLSERAAMYVPVTADGATGWFQVDTALDVTRIYGRFSERQGWEADDGFVLAPDFAVGDIALGPTWMQVYDSGGFGEEDSLSGSLGLDVCAGRLLLLDLVGDRLALLTPGQLPAALRRRTTWAPAEIREAKFFLSVSLGGQSMTGFFFDTGSSAFPIIMDRSTWCTLTGRSGPEDATECHNVSSWGEQRRVIGAPALGPLVIGSARLVDPLVYYLEDQPRMFASWPFPVDGLIGNAAFWGHIVLLDLGLRPRLGLLTED